MRRVRDRAAPPRWVGLLVAIGLVAGLGTGCGDGGDPEAFCDRVADIDGLAEVIEGYAAIGPRELARRSEAAVTRYERLAEVAPDEVRDDVDILTEGVRTILAAIEAHPDDDDALRAELADAEAELARSGEAAAAISTYAREECGIDLDDA